MSSKKSKTKSLSVSNTPDIIATVLTVVAHAAIVEVDNPRVVLAVLNGSRTPIIVRARVLKAIDNRWIIF